MNYLILSTFIVFCFIYNTSCERCDDLKFKNCWVIDKSNVAFWIVKCCKAPHKKNEINKTELGEGEICIKDETFYCCPQHESNPRSKKLCENSINEFRKKCEVSTTTDRTRGRKSTTKISLTHSKLTVSENKILALTEIDRFKNRENSSIYEPKTTIATTKEPVIAAEDHKIYFPSDITVNSNSPISTEIVTKPGKNTSETVATDGHKIPISNDKVNPMLEIELNRNNTQHHKVDNNFSNVQEKAPIDSSNEFSNISKTNKTSKHSQLTESSTTTTKSLITSAPSIVTEKTTPSIINITTPQPNTITTVQNKTKSEQKCDEYGKSNIQKIKIMGLIGYKPREVTIDKCRHKAIPLVVGGREAMPYEFPHQALLGYDNNNRVEWKCGGSLVSRNFILTAAHCIYDHDLGTVSVVKLGAFNQFEDSEIIIIRHVVQIIEHPDFDKLNRIDDIGLLKLDDFVPINEYINPACLPIKQADNNYAIAIGFGATETSFRSRRLMKVVLEKFEPYYPSRIQNETRVEKFIFFGHSTQRKDTCSGDSGSPLQISNDINVKCSYTQIGIVSYGPNECGIPGLPAVYVNVFYYIDWIERYIWVDEDRLEAQNSTSNVLLNNN